MAVALALPGGRPDGGGPGRPGGRPGGRTGGLALPGGRPDGGGPGRPVGRSGGRTGGPSRPVGRSGGGGSSRPGGRTGGPARPGGRSGGGGHARLGGRTGRIGGPGGRRKKKATAWKSGRRGPRGPRPPTPPDVLSVSGGFLYCFNRCYHPSRLVSVQTPWSLAAPRSPQFRFRLHQGRRGARSPSSIQEGRVVRPCLAAALRPSSPLDWLLAVEDSALHPSRAGRTTMASADFSGAFPHRCRCGSPDSIGTAPEISQGKLCILPSVPAGFTNAHVRMTTGPPRPWPGYPTAPALYPIPVRRVRVLPSASFRFHLTVDTLA